MNGVNGRLFTSKNNGKTLFLPAAGSRYEASLGDAGSRGHYWSSSLDSDYPSLAWIHGFNSIDVSASSGNRCAGQSVRAVAAIGNYAAGATYSANADVTLYAQWEDIRARYTIAYDANGGTGAPEAQTKIEGEDLTLATTVPTREGYKFVGWKASNEAGHDYVDLGLPSGLMWATCNIGATQPEEYGDYFAWGETTGYNSGKTTFHWRTYKYCNGSYTQTKYCTNNEYGTVDNITTLELADDAARANWGGNWRMPTHAEQEELLTNCTTEWTAVNGVYGRLFTSNINGKTLFLPAAGCRVETFLRSAGSYGYYWSSSLYSDSPDLAWMPYFNSSCVYASDDGGSRCAGLSVRAVTAFSTYTAGATYSANADVTLYAQWELSEIAVANKGYNSEIIEAADGKSVKVTLADRTIYRDGDWNTLVLPFEVDLNDETCPLYGATARTLASASLTNNGQTLTLNFDEPVTRLEAGVPYIIKWTEKCETDIVNPVFPYVTIDATDGTFCSDDHLVRFCGTYDLVTFDDENKDVLFLGSGNNLYYPDGKATTTIGACRAYFKIGNDEFEADASQLRSIVMDFGEESETVSIENLKLKNEEEIWFTLDGRKAKGNGRGMVVKTGSKRFVK